MGELVSKLVSEDSFDATNKLVRAGHVGAFDTDLLNGKEKHLHDIDGDKPTPSVQIAPITVTGPNPTAPQQIPPDAIQDGSGQYAIPGKRLVGEVTKSEEQRFTPELDPEAEAERSEELSQILDDTSGAGEGGRGTTTGNGDDALVDGTVKEVTADLGSKTDEQLAALAKAENDREQPRKGVITAIEAEQESRKANQS